MAAHPKQPWAKGRRKFSPPLAPSPRIWSNCDLHQQRQSDRQATSRSLQKGNWISMCLPSLSWICQYFSKLPLQSLNYCLPFQIFGPSDGPEAKGWQTLFHIWGMTDIKECETLATGHHYHFFFATSPCQKPFGFTWLLFTTYTKCIWSSELYRLDNPESFVVVRASWNQISLYISRAANYFYEIDLDWFMGRLGSFRV
jgi:hypothetical protein